MSDATEAEDFKACDTCSAKEFGRGDVSYERIRMVGPMSKSKEVMSALYDSGFTIVQTGPYTNKRMFPRCDAKRFLFIAERDFGALGGLGSVSGLEPVD